MRLNALSEENFLIRLKRQRVNFSDVLTAECVNAGLGHGGKGAKDSNQV